MGNKTYAPRGSKQIAVLGKEEKRQFTAMVATSASGKMLLMQCVWSSKTHLSLPWKNVRSDSELRGNCWVPGGDSHWSSLETMKQWVLDILVPCIERIKQDEGLPEDSMILLIIDCTGKFQPADVGIQQIFKHLIKSAALEWIAAETKKQIDDGTCSTAVEIPTEIAPLWNASVAWIDALIAQKLGVVLIRSGPLQQSRLKCETKNWNLSYEALTSQHVRLVVLERIDEDPAFALSVATESKGHLEDANQEMEPEFDDDTALSTADLVAAHFDGETVDVEEDEAGGGGC
ncbi:hypothetical protein FRC01_004886 [Tulasnella sp. 417]|nr:hypothetical protein FRC01_004886 [Tulasnella sp. 417]